MDFCLQILQKTSRSFATVVGRRWRTFPRPHLGQISHPLFAFILPHAGELCNTWEKVCLGVFKG